MEIRPNEVESVKVIGHLHGEDVKLIKTTGGFFCAVGKKSKNGKKGVEPLAAGSHFALVNHAIEKEYKNEFKPAIFKSESESLPIVTEYTKKLPQEMVDAGYQVFTMVKNEQVNFVATKLGYEVVNLEAKLSTNGIDNVVNVGKPTNTQVTDKLCSVIAEVINERF
jgi:hypothetical protein